ncbi:MAG: DUF2934 domain-containing protein [Candidatus Omnitrophica bacterium]|nr:DUF2934 domain-containing protein [Candidatus Omnitrophota bacterium]MDD5670412.1 DUF2934 domain-containing protein [Candidatus Omnitrophota bacterium]
MAKDSSNSGWSKSQTSSASGSDVTARIQKKAKELWEKKGRVQGKDLENWLEAERLVKSGKA